MTPMDVTNAIRDHIQQVILEGEEIELAPDTPLLELGILNSISVLTLVGFLEKRFHLIVPPKRIAPANLTTLEAITKMVLELNPTP